jgi:hypothetical protein
MIKDIVKYFTIATTSTVPFIPTQAGSINFRHTPMKGGKTFTFSISTLWGYFIFIYSQPNIRIMFKERDS